MSDLGLKSEPRAIDGRLEAILFIGIVTCGAMARLSTLGFDSLWHDEGYTQAIIRLPFHHLLTVPYDNHPPGYYALEKLWVGDRTASEYMLRLPSAIASILTFVPVYFLARQLMGGVGALATLAVYACSFEDLVYAGDARSYAVLSMYLLTSLLSLYMAFKNFKLTAGPRSWSVFGWIGLYVLSASAAVYTHNVAVLFIFSANAIFMLQIFVGHRELLGRAIIFCVLLNAPVVLVWLPYAVSIPSTMGWVKGWLQQPGPKTAFLMLLAVLLPNWTGIAGAVASLLGMGAGFALMVRQRGDLFYVTLFLALLFPLTVWAAGFVITPVFLDRTLLVAQVGAALLIGAVAAFLRPAPLAIGVFVVSFLPYVASSIAYLERTGQEGSYSGHIIQNWRGLLRQPTSSRTSPDAIILCDDFSYPTTRYYAPDKAIYVLRGDQSLLGLTDAAWLYLYGLPVKERLTRVSDHIADLQKSGQVELPNWDEFARRYKNVWTARATALCAPEFDKLISGQLEARDFAPPRDVSTNGVAAQEFTRKN